MQQIRPLQTPQICTYCNYLCWIQSPWNKIVGGATVVAVMHVISALLIILPRIYAHDFPLQILDATSHLYT